MDNWALVQGGTSAIWRRKLSAPVPTSLVVLYVKRLYNSENVTSSTDDHTKLTFSSLVDLANVEVLLIIHLLRLLSRNTNRVSC